MKNQVSFDSYRDALLFLKEMGAGKVKRQTDSDDFLWELDSGQLTKEQLEIIAEANGTKFLWKDSETGLSWLLRDCGRYEIDSLNKSGYGGYNDWRAPTLRELKSLACTTKNTFGLFAKESAGGRLNGNYVSCTKHWQEAVWWNFNTGKSAKEEYSDGKIKWGSEGDFAGFEDSVHHNYATLILVRGDVIENLSDWASKLREWAEEDGVLDFPSTQENMEKLEDLTLFFSTTIPKQVSMLRNLKRLTCYALSGFEKVIFSIPSLEELKLLRPNGKQPAFDEIPPTISNLTSLLSLDAGGIHLNKVHESIGDLRKLKHLDLNVADAIPDSITNMHELRTLRLSGIRSLPHSIGDLKSLEKLSVFGRFERIPNSIENLTQLQELTIRSGQLSELPEGLFKLGNLHTLTIYEATIEIFPNALLKMPLLKTLDLCDTPIYKLPEDIANMESLERLNLRETRISELPRSLVNLDNLRLLYLSNTKIQSLPEWLKDMKSLSKIRAKGIKVPPALKDKIVYLY
ncbi:leucine-rich repeat domain-containing protein [Stutzerimonas nitrititolerans]|uniref:leucine-rich repeat domain-containing protein n=1 Tax=Stutzerimonas nitrititolerans TaxID=2482751 RepID=UPI00289F2222|nr:DUF1566 domain-containing protein [Stutzerimonas nitrititolerans]